MGVILYIAIFVLVYASVWKVFEKAGKPGWAGLVPIYNFIVMLEIAKKPLWWVALLFIPFANIVVGVLIMMNIAKSFGKGTGFAIGMILLPFVFWPMLGFGDAQYVEVQE